MRRKPGEYIHFEWPAHESEIKRPCHTLRPCKFSVGDYNKRLVQEILQYNGLQQTYGNDFTIFWGTPRETDGLVVHSARQKINHFPHSKAILSNKAELARAIQENPNYNVSEPFLPRTFALPQDRDKLFRLMRMHPKQLFISKPAQGSCGNGIKIISSKDIFMIPQEAVVSEYISRPLLIDGFKFDLRIYVLVTSFDPLSVFIFKDGLARFCTEAYSLNTTSIYAHLTNATLNKRGRAWTDEFKWTLHDLLREIAHRYHHSPDEIMSKIINVVRNTLTLVQPKMAKYSSRSFFEIYGFDILLDRDFRAWLIEINTMPALGTSEEADYIVKARMIAQAFTIVGISDGHDAQDVGEDERNKLSGSGFIRISTLPTLPILAPPLVDSNKAKSILISFLKSLEPSLMKGDIRVLSRVQCFLVAQGYSVVRGNGVRALLHRFLEKISDNSEPSDFNISQNECKKLLLSADLSPVKNVALLFP